MPSADCGFFGKSCSAASVECSTLESWSNLHHLALLRAGPFQVGLATSLFIRSGQRSPWPYANGFGRILVSIAPEEVRVSLVSESNTLRSPVVFVSVSAPVGEPSNSVAEVQAACAEMQRR
jgi:hypothetical protein